MFSSVTAACYVYLLLSCCIFELRHHVLSKFFKICNTSGVGSRFCMFCRNE